MRELISGDLTFRNFNKNECTSDQESDDKRLYQFCIDQLNTWTDESIIKGLELDSEPLGKSLNSTHSIFEKTSLYFIFKEQELVGTTLLTPQTIPYDIRSLSYYIDHCNFSRITELNGFMNKEKAIHILNNANSNSCYINSLAVNPKHQHKGIGSQIISTLASNIDFFDPSPTHTALVARIHNENQASLKAFKNNGFETFFKIDLSNYNTFYKTL